MATFEKLFPTRRSKIVVIIIGVIIIDIVISTFITLSEERIYNADRDEIYVKLESLFFWMISIPGVAFMLAFLGLILLTIAKKIIQLIKWILS